MQIFTNLKRITDAWMNECMNIWDLFSRKEMVNCRDKVGQVERRKWPNVVSLSLHQLFRSSFPRETSRTKRHTTLLSRLNLIKAKDKTEGMLVICRSKYNLRQSAGYMTKGTRSRHFWTEISYLGTNPAFIIIAFFILFISLTFAWTALSGFQSTGNVLSFICP